MGSNQVLDMQVVEELLSLTDNGDPELLLDLINLFLDDGPAKIRSIVEGLEARDFDRMERAAHSLKGSAGNLGAQRLQHTCEQMQQATRSHQFEMVRTLAPLLESQFGDARQALEDLRRRYS